jgi:hypothetical protein
LPRSDHSLQSSTTAEEVIAAKGAYAPIEVGVSLMIHGVLSMQEALGSISTAKKKKKEKEKPKK